MNILKKLPNSVREILECCHKKQKGQTAVETFILTSTFLLVVFFGTIQITIICFNILTANEAVFMSNRSSIVQKNFENAQESAKLSCLYILSKQISKDNIFYYNIKLKREKFIHTASLTYYQKVMFLGRYFYKGIVNSKMAISSSIDFLDKAYPGAKKWEE